MSVLAEAGGTGQVPGEGDLASKPAAGAATAAGYPVQNMQAKCSTNIKV